MRSQAELATDLLVTDRVADPDPDPVFLPGSGSGSGFSPGSGTITNSLANA